MSNPTPSPWTHVPEGTTLCSKHYEQALAANRAHSVVRPSSAPANVNNSGASAGPPLSNGRRTALSDGHGSGGEEEESAAAGNSAPTTLLVR